MKLFHGTTLNRFLKMQESGFIGTCDNQVWNVSGYETTYFWTEEFLRDERGINDIDGETEDLVLDAGIYYARESAEMALASERTNLRRVVLVLDSEDLDPELLEEDDSCENMEHCMQYRGLIPLDKVKAIYADTEDLDLFALFFIGMGVNRNESNWSGIRANLGENEELSTTVLNGAKDLYNAMCETWYDEISYSFELEEYYRDSTGTLINSYSHYPLIEG